jgi:hypothetical protein
MTPGTGATVHKGNLHPPYGSSPPLRVWADIA